MEQLRAGDPQEIGGYRLSHRLGAGGMGAVYLGRSPGGRSVAVKVIRSEYAADPEFRARFRREVTAMRAVSGAFTAAVVDADVEAPEPWLAAVYVPGPSLAETLSGDGPMEPAAVLVLAAGLAEALHEIHRAGLAHRDLKPSNVLLAADGPRVIDFGLAVTKQASTLTKAGTVMGTISYMSPEQVEGRQVGPASDLFSFAVLLVHAATGRLPFPGESTGAVLHAILTKEPDLRGIEQPLLGVVQACLNKNPDLRPAAKQVLGTLAALTDTAAPSATAAYTRAATAQVRADVTATAPGWADAPPTPPQGARPAHDAPPTQDAPRHQASSPFQGGSPYAGPTGAQGQGYGYGYGGTAPQQDQFLGFGGTAPQQDQFAGYGPTGNPYAPPVPGPRAATGHPYQNPYQNPYLQPFQQRPPLAAWPRRFAATALDAMIALIPYTIIASIGAHQSTTTGADPQGPLTGLAAFYVIVIGVVQLAMQGSTGASIGKRVLGIRLVDVGGLRPIGFWRCVARQFCHFFDTLPLYVGWFAPLWTAEKQTFADMMMSTIVVKDG